MVFLLSRFTLKKKVEPMGYASSDYISSLFPDESEAFFQFHHVDHASYNKPFLRPKADTINFQNILNTLRKTN